MIRLDLLEAEFHWRVLTITVIVEFRQDVIIILTQTCTLDVDLP